jgi:PIN domain nuclease of toxin-antitoxin system
MWWLAGGKRLSARARRTVENQTTTVFVSAASFWEIAIKHQSGKLDGGAILDDFQQQLDSEGFVELPISAKHAIRAGLLPGPHKDPFDRLLVAQAEIESVPIVSRNASLDGYNVPRIW